MSKEAQMYYQILKDNNELKQIFPKATDEWEKDKSKFSKFYDENIKFVLDFENGTLDDTEDYFDDNDDTSVY